MVFYPLSFPIATVLDMVLGEEIGLSYSRDELVALLAMHSVGGRTKQGPQGDIHDTCVVAPGADAVQCRPPCAHGHTGQCHCLLYNNMTSLRFSHAVDDPITTQRASLL